MRKGSHAGLTAMLAVFFLLAGCMSSGRTGPEPEGVGTPAERNAGDRSDGAAPSTVAAAEGAPGRAPLPPRMRFRGSEDGFDIFAFTAPGFELEMVYVPPGEFVMGADDGGSDARPRHTHRVDRGYFIARHPVTWGQYRDYVRGSGEREPPKAPPWGQRSDHPVTNVSWHEAKAFCDWFGLALPTEAQWEKAARGADGRRYPWGNDEPTPDHCFWDGLAADGNNVRTAPVGGRPLGASPYGAHDMVGYVTEWCADWYDEGAYARYAQGDRTPAKDGLERVYRGGWQRSTPPDCSVSRRYAAPNFPSLSRGFRPVLVP